MIDKNEQFTIDELLFSMKQKYKYFRYYQILFK